MEAEKKNNENRDKARFTEISPIKITENKSDIEYDARMLNYSANGLYFESDSLIDPDTEIYFAIQNEPSDLDKSDYGCRAAKIAWRRDLDENAYFYYGYGAYFTQHENEAANNPNGNSLENNRVHKRKSLRKSIILSDKGNIYKGETVNISPTGVFIKSDKKFSPEDELTFSIRSSKKRSLMLKGKVVWSNQDGFGLKFSKIEKD